MSEVIGRVIDSSVAAWIADIVITGASPAYVDGKVNQLWGYEAIQDASILLALSQSIVGAVAEASLGTDFLWNAGLLGIDVSLLPLGPIGPQGSTGLSGTTPIKGIDYFDGSQGIPGIDGIDGSQGLSGINGINGINGIDGYSPIKNIDYFDGSVGINGINGIDGSQGISGLNGTDGIDGLDGYTPIKNIDYFDGSQGIPGTNGTNGTNGINGIDGSQGIQGVAGAAGAVGVDGINGIDGSQGIQGIQGIPGTNGTNGLDGYSPIKGIDYFDGSTGLAGYTPIKGIDYFDGSQGIQGGQGIQGVQGTPGADGVGADGIQGIQGIQGIPGLINDASAGYGLFWNGGLLDVSIVAGGSIPGVANGLVILSDGSIGFGGVINQYTQIDISSHTLFVGDILGSVGIFMDGAASTAVLNGLPGQLNLDGNLDEITLNHTNSGAYIALTMNGMIISSISGDSLTLSPSESYFYNATGGGLKYASDYSSTFIERSLIDRGYLDACLGFVWTQFSEIDTSIQAINDSFNASLANYTLKTQFDSSIAALYTNTYIDASFNRVYTDVSNNYVPINAKFSTANSAYLVSASDNNNIILVDVSALTITFPNTLSAGFQTTVVNETTGICTLNASTLLTTDSSVVLRDRYAAASVVCKSAGVFLAFGNLK